MSVTLYIYLDPAQAPLHGVDKRRGSWRQNPYIAAILRSSSCLSLRANRYLSSPVQPSSGALLPLISVRLHRVAVYIGG